MTQSTFSKALEGAALVTRQKNIDIEWEQSKEKDLLFSNVRIFQSEDVLSAQSKALEEFEKTINVWIRGRDGDIATIMKITNMHFGTGGSK